MSKATEKTETRPAAQVADPEGAQPPDWRKGLPLREFRRNVNRIQGNPNGVPEGEWTP